MTQTSKKVRIQLGVDSNFIERLAELAPQFRMTPNGLAADLLSDALRERERIEEWLALRMTFFFSRKVFGTIQPSGDLTQLQVYLDEETAQLLERYSKAMGLALGRAGGTLLESALNDEKWIMNAALQVAKGVKAIQSAKKGLGRKRQAT